MQTILESTMAVFDSMGLQGEYIPTPPGYVGLFVDLPNDFQAYLVWSKMDDNDFAFRVARFYESDSLQNLWTMNNLIDAVAHMRFITNQ